MAQAPFWHQSINRGINIQGGDCTPLLLFIIHCPHTFGYIYNMSSFLNNGVDFFSFWRPYDTHCPHTPGCITSWDSHSLVNKWKCRLWNTIKCSKKIRCKMWINYLICVTSTELKHESKSSESFGIKLPCQDIFQNAK